MVMMAGTWAAVFGLEDTYEGGSTMWQNKPGSGSSMLTESSYQPRALNLGTSSQERKINLHLAKARFFFLLF